MKEKPGPEEILGLVVMTAVFAAMSYSLFQLTGIHDFLVRLSIGLAKEIFALFGI